MKPGHRVLVTGGTGAVGPAVVAALHAAGWSVRVLAAAPPEPGLLPDAVESVIGDVTDAAAVSRALAGVQAVVHMAALLHETGRRSAAAEYRRVNVEGTRTVTGEATDARVARLVLLSTISVYGDLDGRTADETTPPRPTTPYGETKLAAEELVLEARTREGLPIGVVLRPAAVYGPRIKGNYRRLVAALARGRFVPVGRGANRRTLVFDQDLASAVVLAVDDPRAAGRVFNVSDGDVHTVREVIGAMCAALGRRPPRWHIPMWAAAAAAELGELGRHAGLDVPLGREALRKYREDVAVSSVRIRNELGFRPAYGLRDGWRMTVAALRASGAL